MNIQWDAEKYTTDFSFVHQYGTSLLDWIEGERLDVLDLGCGNGALTYALSARGHHAEGLDASGELLDIARGKYPELRFIQANAVDFQAERPYDVIFSNAVLHWIDQKDQPVLTAHVFDALKPKGQFIFEFGGHGNNVLIHEALQNEFERRGLDYQMPFYFPTIGNYTSLLEEAGFLVRNAVLWDRPTRLNGCDGLYDWICMFLKSPFSGLDGGLCEEIIRSAVRALEERLYRDGVWYADYVRLRGKAVKP